jgi:hypothetical protein
MESENYPYIKGEYEYVLEIDISDVTIKPMTHKAKFLRTMKAINCNLCCFRTKKNNIVAPECQSIANKPNGQTDAVK